MKWNIQKIFIMRLGIRIEIRILIISYLIIRGQLELFI